jgi:hypothetical protein
VTPEHLATAFRTPAARTLFERARAARLEHDSTLRSYDAKTYQRVSAGLGLKRFGRDRLFFRYESSARVRWERGKGALVEVTGARGVAPLFGRAGRVNVNAEVEPIPYYPGRDALWVGAGVVRREVDDRQLVHPLAEGAEAYYRYSVGDSVVYRLPDGKQLRLVELEVQARRPHWNLIVGSFWFDVSTAQLVRAAYRLSVPMDIAEAAKDDEDLDDDDDVPRWLRPMTANIKGIVVEYGLHKGQWWLPRLQVAEGEVQVSAMRLPLKLEQSFRYGDVNGVDTIPDPSTFAQRLDSAGAAALRRRRRSGLIDEGDATVRIGDRFDTLRVVTRLPKDTARLRQSPDLPRSIFDDTEAVLQQAQVEELMKELDFDLQAQWGPQRPTLHYGLEDGLLRYNRVEGLSAGIALDQRFGLGLQGRAMARIGTADVEPNGELAVERSDGRRTLGIGAYRRLAVANDWGDPLALGASLNAFLFARDEGLYYRTLGAELTGTHERGMLLTWRLFAERQSDADVETQFSLAKAINDIRFIENIVATRGTVGGIAARLSGSRGVDPHSFRLTGDLRAEAAAGTFDYVRGAAEATITRGLGRRLDGALTLGAGTSGGAVPPQRLWYLGGAHSIRGQRIGSAAGDAFWMARAELGTSLVAARPVLFYDLGWAGPRADWQHPGTPLSGAGVGVSFMDGLLRFDLSKGIRPSRGVRADMYVEARF